MGHEGYPSPCRGPPSGFDISCDIKLHEVSLDTVFRDARGGNKRVFRWYMDGRFFNRSSRVGGIIDAAVQNLDTPRILNDQLGFA